MLISGKKKLIYLLCTKTNKLPSYFVYSLFQSMRKSPSSLLLLLALHALRTVIFFPGKTSAARILGTRNQCSAIKAMIINCKWGKSIQFVVTTTRKMDYSIGATLEMFYSSFCGIFGQTQPPKQLLIAGMLTMLASNISQVSLGTGHYLCRWGREKRRGVKAISDWLEGEGLNQFIKKFRRSAVRSRGISQGGPLAKMHM